MALLALAVAGCGGSGGGRGGESAASAPAADRLIVRDYDGSGQTGTTALYCGAAGDRCERVVALLPRLTPEPGEVCAQIYGGPERRVVEGVVDGRAVRVEVTRTDGCAIARYDLLTRALRTGPAPGYAP